MAIWGEASVKVKKAILLVEKFTVNQITDITGIKFQSVETVIRRLLNEGTLIKANSNEENSSVVGLIAKKGRPRQHYIFASAEKVKVLKNNLESITLEKSITEPFKQKPQNPHFVKAASLIGHLESSPSAITGEAIDEIEKDLNLAGEYEDIFDENNETAQAHIDFERARLEYLKGERDDAEIYLNNAKAVFNKYKMEEEQVVDEHLISSTLKALVQETRKALTNKNFETLSTKLNRLFANFSNGPSFPVISTQVKEFTEIVGKLSDLTGKLQSENSILDNQVHSLTEENDLLKIQNQLSTEINYNLSEAVKIRPVQEVYYPQQELPKTSFEDKSEEFKLPENITSMKGFQQNRKRRAAY